MADEKTQPQQPPQPLLSLNTFSEHAFILINGERYDLANVEEFSITDYHRLARAGEVVREMMRAPNDLSDAQAKRVSSTLETLVRMVLRAPEEVQARLSDSMRLRIAQAFTGLHREVTGMPDAAAPSAPSTGEKK
jgi:hypothetical protein